MKISPMRRALGLVLFMIGVVWFFIGTNLISDSQWSGQMWLAAVGATIAVAGLAVLQLQIPERWRRTKNPTEPNDQDPDPAS